MLPRKPTRIELKPEDKEEYVKLKQAQELQAQQAGQEQQQGGVGGAQSSKKQNTASRIGLPQSQ